VDIETRRQHDQNDNLRSLLISLSADSLIYRHRIRDILLDAAVNRVRYLRIAEDKRSNRLIEAWDIIPESKQLPPSETPVLSAGKNPILDQLMIWIPAVAGFVTGYFLW